MTLAVSTSVFCAQSGTIRSKTAPKPAKGRNVLKHVILPPGRATHGRRRLMLLLPVPGGSTDRGQLALPDIPAMCRRRSDRSGALPVSDVSGCCGVNFSLRDGTLVPVLVAAFCSHRFVLIYQGLRRTTASRAPWGSSPPHRLVALVSYRILANSCAPRMGPDSPEFAVLRSRSRAAAQWSMRTCCARRSPDRRAAAHVGCYPVIAKGTALRLRPPQKALGYQVAISIPILAAAAWLSAKHSLMCLVRSQSPFVTYQADLGSSG